MVVACMRQVCKLIKCAYYKAFSAERNSSSELVEDETSHASLSDSASKASPPSSSKSYKEAVTTTQGSALSVPQHNQLQDRLAQLEVMVKNHQHKLNTIEREAEAAQRKERELDLVLYNIPKALEDDADRDAVCTLVRGTHDLTVAMTRLGTRSPEQSQTGAGTFWYCHLM